MSDVVRSVRALSLYRVCKALCYLRVLWPLNYQVLSGVQLSSFRFPNASFHFALEARALDLYSGVGYALARRNCVFALINSEYRAETSGDPRMPEPPAPSPPVLTWW
ncbi:hypothetical protein EVAR_76299_1 [Eumeta japonica]|uniref:Uncharacterized protein n=1 Tax=Eumeta variegata TaxID=151549 RepID=A0A4C1UQT4_EUMVA|nr:hypothetical protein EVAR_76299_1 [Eumeta japonica]